MHFLFNLINSKTKPTHAHGSAPVRHNVGRYGADLGFLLLKKMKQVNNHKHTSYFSWTILGAVAILVAINLLTFQSREVGLNWLTTGQLVRAQTSGLVAHWSFDEGTGTTVTDSTGNGHTGTINGASWKSGTDCISGSCLSFDGADDYVDMGSDTSLDNLGPLTYAAWIKSDVRATQIILSKAGPNPWSPSIEFYLSSASPEFRVRGNSQGLKRYADFGALTPTDWNHIVLTWDGSVNAANVHIYINGVETTYRTTQDGTDIYDSTGKDMYIGSIENVASPFDGLIDDVRIYNIVLSNSEIADLAGVAVPTPAPPPAPSPTPAPPPPSPTPAPIVSASGLPAFPGAEGFGALSVGGRGGTVIKVTNLNPYGPGSFREAVTTAPRHYANNTPEWETKSEYETRVATGNTKPRHYPNGDWENELDTNYLKRLEETAGHRIVVFEVSGIINLESDLTISIPYITIAGETSPGGILITGFTTTVNTHDVIIRHMRFRVGSHQIVNGADAEQLDSFNVLGLRWGQLDTYNIIIDHSSFSWGVDETMTISGGVKNMTLQWSIVSEGLKNAGHPEGEHSKGLMVSGKYQYDNSVSLHHNYIAHNTARNPNISTPTDVEVLVDFRNNISYNWAAGLAPLARGTVKVNWVHNYAKPGPESYTLYEITQTAQSSVTPAPLLYVYGNIGTTRLNQSEPQWNVGNYWRAEPASTAWQKLTPWPVPPVTTTEMSYDYALEILADVGATKPFRDSVDARVVADFAAGTGAIIDNVTYPDDYPTFPNLPYPTDSDDDGMSDNWEIANSMNPNVADDKGDNDGDGYTNIEEYLHSLAGALAVSPNPVSVPTSIPQPVPTLQPTPTPNPTPTPRSFSRS